MFKSTQRQLTVLNSMVFLFVFVVFNAIIYGYLSLKIFDWVDADMLAQAEAFRVKNRHSVVANPPPPYDPRIFILLRSTDGRIINPVPFRKVDSGNIPALAVAMDSEQFKTETYQGHVYRVISIPYTHTETIFEDEPDFFVERVIAVSIVDSEVKLLDNFFWITVAGGLAGVIGICLAGYFLAKRAMVPIQAAWSRQQQFVSDASHELRSPITGIYSNAELMLRHPTHTIAQESQRLEVIMTESRRMTKLIASLLTLARADAKKAELQLERVDISEVIEVAIERFQAVTELSHIKLISHIQPKVEMVADRDRMHQLIVILMDNAFKYTLPGGIVRIDCYQTEQQIVLQVQDTGTGIAAEHVPYIFDRFFRTDKARSRESGGTGLGLSIGKWIVEKHKGKIEVQSEYGQGSQFTVFFPADKK